jgi:hypothetical protein
MSRQYAKRVLIPWNKASLGSLPDESVVPIRAVSMHIQNDLLVKELFRRNRMLTVP